ncbi:MAG TPA: MFS transporter [Gemmatimonadaceae bacterium]|nr:MFS transporter [Gemmatimonadaceae bacterium]
MTEPSQTLPLRARVAALPRPAWALFAGTFINRFGSFVLVFLVLYLTRKGYSPAQAGLAASVYGLGHVLASLFGGHLADYLGRRRTIALSMFSAAAALLALSQVSALPLIIILTGFVGLTAELYRPAAAALLADLTPAGQRVTAFALYRMAINLGVAAGPAVAGFLAERSFTLLFVGDAITSAAYGAIALIALPEGTRVRSAEERAAGAMRAILADRRFLRLILATTAIALVIFQGYSTVPLHIDALGYSSRVYGALMSLNGVLIVCFELALTSFTHRAPAPRVIAAGYLLTGIGFALTGVALSLPMLAFSVVIWTLGEMLCSPVSAAHVADIAPQHMRGRYQAAFGLTFSIGTILAPMLGTLLFSWSSTSLWIACAALGVASALLVRR